VRAAPQVRQLAGAEGEVVSDDVLVEHVIGVQDDVAGFDFGDDGLLSWRKLAQFGYPEFDDEPAARGKVPGRIAEARNLPFLAWKAGDRVVDQVEERVDVRRWSCHPQSPGWPSRRPWFAAADHRSGHLDTGDGHAAQNQRHCDAAGADGELRRPAVTGELGKPVHSRPENLRSEHASARRVISPGRLVIPGVLRPHGDTM
jgi:hypothetical protein